jgi:hypothetical protein
LGDGLVLHFDGEFWSEMAHPSGYERIWALWGAAQDSVFAIAAKTDSSRAILHYDGQAWTEMQTEIAWPFDKLWGTSGTDVYAMGTVGLVYHYMERILQLVR